MKELTWKCHICGKTRPDERISVYSTDISDRMNLPLKTAKQNVRYCNDNPECVEAAKTFDFIKTSVVK